MSKNDLVDSKLTQLLGNFDIDLEKNDKEVKSDIVFLIEENKNNSVYIKMTNDQKHFVEIERKVLDLELGQKILDNFLCLNKKKVNNIFEVDNSLTDKKLKSAISIKKSIISDKALKEPKRIKHGLSFKLETDILFSDKKIPKLNIRYKDYIFNTPKCEVCNNVGISYDEIKRINSSKQAMIDIITLDYILYSCINCKIYVHHNCLIDSGSIPFINIKEKNLPNWICDRCSEEDSGNCQICLTNKNGLYIKLDNNYTHFLCSIWVDMTVYSIDNLFTSKLNRISETQNNLCCICYGDKKSFTIKCSMKNCDLYFHAICMKQRISYYDITNCGDNKFCVFYCEEHSRHFISNTINQF